MSWDVVVVGGGPAGLAAALAAARRGARVVVVEQRSGPPDKACGEGLLPPALAALDALGVGHAFAREDAAPFSAVRWVEEDGRTIEARLPGGGLGVRRTALTAALARAAAAAGVELRFGVRARGFRRGPERIVLETDAGPLAARLLVAADGLGSPIRRAAGLDRPARGPRRFGMRRHYAVAPWADAVELHLDDGVEAYVTPSGAGRVGVAFLWEDGRVRADWDELLARFPRLGARLEGAPPETAVRGAGPLARRARALAADRLVLLGDAAGYVDAITGEGLSLAFEAALLLGEHLPAVLEAGAGRAALAPWARAYARRYRRYALVTRAVLALARRPRLRRLVLAALGRRPDLLAGLIAWALAPAPRRGSEPPAAAPPRWRGETPAPRRVARRAPRRAS